MSSPPLTVEAVTSEDGVSCLREDWNRLSLATDSPNVFMTFDWFQAWYSHFARTKGAARQSPNVLVLRNNGAVVGISPLIRTVSSRFGFVVLRRLQFVWRNYEWDYNDLVQGADKVPQVQAVVGFLGRSQGEWDVVDLRNLRDTGNAITDIEGELTRAGLPYLRFPEEERSPYMPISGPWSEVVSRRSSRSRDTFRRMQTRLDRMASQGLRVRIVDDPAKEPRLLEKMIAIEARKRVAGDLSVPFLGRYADVFATVFDKLGPQGWIRVAVMELGDRLIGWEFIFQCGGKLWSYLGAYDHDFSDLSPGTMLFPAVIDYGFSRGYTEYDFLNGEEPYKLPWATGFHQTFRLLIWNRRWISRLRAAAYRRSTLAR